MKGGGIWAETQTSRHLLQQQLGQGVCFYEDLETFRKACSEEKNSWFLREEAEVFCLKIRSRETTLPKPLKLVSLYGLLDRVSQTYVLGCYVFDPMQRTLSSRKQEPEEISISLREKESQLLLALLEAPQYFVSRDDLLEIVWGVSPEALIETRTLESHIYQLRQKLEPQAREPQILVSKDGGYQLVLSEALSCPERER